MIHDEDLRSSFDYSEGQKAAAHRVLVELVNLFNEYRDDIRIDRQAVRGNNDRVVQRLYYNC